MMLSRLAFKVEQDQITVDLLVTKYSHFCELNSYAVTAAESLMWNIDIIFSILILKVAKAFIS